MTLRVFLQLLAVASMAFFGGSCTSLIQDKVPFAQRPFVEEYAQQRYLLALDFLAQSRFELARQQFLVASLSAESAELVQKAQEGYEKVEAIIMEQR